MLSKIANVEKILDVKSSSERIAHEYGEEAVAGLNKFAALNDGIKESDGFLYVRCRAISSRVNKNNDGWPSEELMAAHKSFVGRPVFVDHNNNDPKRTRGVIVSADCHVEDAEKHSRLDPYYATAPDNHKPPTWIELLIEVDAKTYPKLAKSIRNSDIDAVSMGANIEKSVCSVCEHEASTPQEYCSHIKQKGLTFEITSDNGDKIRKKAYEDCYGVNFFEISFVFDPADTTALISDKKGKVASTKTSEGLENVPIGLLDDAYFAIHPKDNEDALTQALQEGNDPKAYKIADHLSQQDHPENPYFGLTPDEVVQQVQAKLGPVDTSIVSKVRDKAIAAMLVKKADNILDQFVVPVGTKTDSDNLNYIPQSEMTTAPQEVNTLRAEHLCPVCRAADMKTDPDGIERCPTCGHVQEPEPVNNPDLSVARDTDLRMDNSQMADQDGNTQIPVTDGSDQVEFTPSQETTPVTMSATKAHKAEDVISEMFTTIISTESKKEADQILPAKSARVNSTLGGDAGIHIGTVKAVEALGSARVYFPEVTGEDNFIDLPTKTPVFALFHAQASAEKLQSSISEVPIVIEAANAELASKIAQVIKEEAQSLPSQRTAASDQKKPVLENSKQSDEPKNEVVIKDDLQLRETSTLKEGDTVNIGDKRFKLVIVEENEETEDEEKKDKTVDDVIKEVVDGDKPKADSKSDDSGEDERESEEDDKESKLLAAMRIAEEEIDLGLTEKENKMARIAKIEEESDDAIAARFDLLAQVRSAGLGKPVTKNPLGLRRIPRLAHVVSSSNNTTSNDIPDEALFL